MHTVLTFLFCGTVYMVVITFVGCIIGKAISGNRADEISRNQFERKTK